MGIPRIQGYPMPEQMPADKTGWTLQPARAVLLVHDMQQYFVDFFDASQAPMPELIANIGRLLEACRAAGVPIVYTAQPGNQRPEDRALLTDFWGKGLADRPELVRILPAIAPQSGDTVLEKWRYSAFKRSRLEAFMAERGRDQLLICGVYAHIGCLMTAAEAFMLDIQAFLAGDALADFSRDEHEQALRYAAGRCACALSTGTALAALQPQPVATPVLDRDSLRAEIAEQIGIAPAALEDDDDLLLIGLDSVRLMALVDRWRSLGVKVDFATLASSPTLNAWAAMLCGEPAPLPPAGASVAPSFDALPLTQAQLGVLQGQRMAGDDSVFHAAECIEISGSLDVALFTQALDATLAEASSLHLRLFERDGQGADPWQQPIAPRPSGLQLQDLGGIDAAGFEAELDRALAQPFDPEAGLLFEHRLYRFDDERHCWLHRAHHLLLDGYGFQMIARRVAGHYQAGLSGGSAGPSPFSGLAAVVEADRAYQQSTARAVDRQFWLDNLAGQQPRSLAAQPVAGIARGRRHGSELPAPLSALLKCRAAEFGLSWPELITAGFAGYLAIHGHGRDVVLGMPVMQRLGSPALNVPCTAMNVMPLPLPDAAGQSLALLAGSLRMIIQRQRPHQRYRFEHLEHDLETGGYSRGLLATEINVMPFGHPERLGACRLSTRILAAGPVEDLAAIFVSQGDSIGFDLDGRAENYTAAELATHAQRFVSFFGSWLEQPWMAAAELS